MSNSRTIPSSSSLSPLVVILLMIVELGQHHFHCLSLDEVHSTLPSMNRHRMRMLQENKSLREALQSISSNQRRKSFPNNYDEPEGDDETHLPTNRFNIDQFSLPIDLNTNYLMKESNGIANKRQDEVVMDIPLEYTQDSVVPYEFYPELWPSDLKSSKDEDSSSLQADILSAVLAQKISDLLRHQQSQQLRPGLIPSLNDIRKKKRTLVKRNNRMSGTRRSKPIRQSNVPTKNTKPNRISQQMEGHLIQGDRKFGRISASKSLDKNLGKNGKKTGLRRAAALAKGEAQASVRGRRPPPVISPYIRKIMKNTTNVNSHESRKLRKNDLPMVHQGNSISKKDSVGKTHHSTGSTSSSAGTRKLSPVKEYVDEMGSISLHVGPKKVVKRSAVVAVNDDGDDGKDDIDDLMIQDDETAAIDSMVDTDGTTSQPKLVAQSNPWLVDEATRNLMRSLTVKRKKRGGDADEDDVDAGDADIGGELADALDLNELENQDEDRVKKEAKESINQLETVSPKNNGKVLLESKILEGIDDDDDNNDTFLEEEFAEGLISIGDSSDLLDDSNETNIVEGKSVKEKRVGAQKNVATSAPEININYGEDEEAGPRVDDKDAGGRGEEDGEDVGQGQTGQAKRKRKRSIAPYFGKVDESLMEEEEEKFTDVDSKLEKIEEALIWEALDMIKGNINRNTPSKESRKRIENRLDAAYDLEDMRLALNDLHKTMQTMGQEDDSDGQEDELDDDRKISSSPSSSASAAASSPSLSSPSASSSVKMMMANNYDSTKIDSDKCSSLHLLTSDCSAVKDVVPRGPLQKLFGQACNWHEVCYSCGGIYGLLSSDCDMGFLEQSRLACNDSSSCETAARLVLMPLRQRRTFYRRSIPEVCYRQSCVGTFLLGSKKRR